MDIGFTDSGGNLFLAAMVGQLVEILAGIVLVSYGIIWFVRKTLRQGT